MKEFSNSSILVPTIGNLKSKIENGGALALVVTFVFGGAVALAQQPKKVPRIGYLSNTDAAS